MPYKNYEDRLARNKSYYKENAESIKKRERDKYRANHKAIRARRNILNAQNKEKRATIARKDYANKRLAIIEHYGGRCSCCGEAEPLFLEIDHINNDGKIHRQNIGIGGRTLILWLIKNNYPDGFQVLCSNCNQGKKRGGGACPHKSKKPA